MAGLVYWHTLASPERACAGLGFVSRAGNPSVHSGGKANDGHTTRNLNEIAQLTGSVTGVVVKCGCRRGIADDEGIGADAAGDGQADVGSTAGVEPAKNMQTPGNPVSCDVVLNACL